MPVTVSCPSCGVKLKAPDTAAGRQLPCPKCRSPISVPAASQPDAVTQSPPRTTPEPRTSAAPAPAATKDCPFCSEPILATARKCKHCGEMLGENPPLAAMSARKKSRREEDDADDGDSREQRGAGGAGHTTVIVNTPKEFPHLVHLIMTFFTCGAWLPVYAIHGLVASKGGGTTLALILGVPLCLAILGCGGCLTMGMLGSAVSRSSSSAPPEPTAGAAQVAASGAASARRPAPAATPAAPEAVAASGTAQVTTTASQLLDRYRGSQVSADAAYKGKVVDVTGTVHTTRLDRDNTAIVELNAGDRRGLLFVQCRMAPSGRAQAQALQEGQQVTIRGRCDGLGARINAAPVPAPAGQPVSAAEGSLRMNEAAANVAEASVVVGDGQLVKAEAPAAPSTRVSGPRPVQWIEGEAPFDYKGLELRVQAVRVEHLNLKTTGAVTDSKKHYSAASYLVVQLYLHNEGLDPFFGRLAPAACNLADEKGNVFAAVANPGKVPTGEPVPPPLAQSLVLPDHAGSLDVQPGQSRKFVLVFEAGPLGKGEQLLLEVPGVVFARAGSGPVVNQDWPEKIGFRLRQKEVVYGPDPAQPGPAPKPATTTGKKGQRPAQPMR